jgi:hypothetical protein
MIRTYSDLRRIATLEGRFRYLSLKGVVGDATFGFDRWINQAFYRSREWKDLRAHVIARDEGCDLGVTGFEIHSQLIIHHLNPMAAIDITSGDPRNLDPEYLITTMLSTHNAIHYGNEKLLAKPYEPRRRGDTKLW